MLPEKDCYDRVEKTAEASYNNVRQESALFNPLILTRLQIQILILNKLFPHSHPHPIQQILPSLISTLSIFRNPIFLPTTNHDNVLV